MRLKVKGEKNFDAFTKINFLYSNSVASVKIGGGFKSEGDLIFLLTRKSPGAKMPIKKIFMEIFYDYTIF